jgi:four helix bundle protein
VNDTHPIVSVPRRYAFDHHRLHAYDVALEALVRGAAIVKSLPRGYGSLGDQLRRALQGAFLQTTEAAARTGADRLARFRNARAEAGEAAGALEAIERLQLANPAAVEEVLALLWRLCAMLTRLAALGR